MDFIAKNQNELGKCVYSLLKDKMSGGFRVGLSGDLGAGKTTLVKMIAKFLGIKDEVTSPTFNLRKIYKITPDLFLQHIDLYRMSSKNQNDLNEVGDWLKDKKTISFVEWPENLQMNQNDFDAYIKIEPLGLNQRKVKITWK
ncbi:MAG: tRNA (adenosine(37)-N6)-threonylcarbamoyltransferase complex ATPase subunit type 1 TsaE [Candidatus Berkelbacteria bacterium]|nr:tRNA (adenosine(37)-N6)-threonylcarbamoyltransferase complex ATPase subunit type 1 TsaE [Candidatus Berkelbacteria bacterium]